MYDRTGRGAGQGIGASAPIGTRSAPGAHYQIQLFSCYGIQGTGKGNGPGYSLPKQQQQHQGNSYLENREFHLYKELS